MQLINHSYALPVSDALIRVLQDEIEQQQKRLNGGICVLFKDPGYSAESGGFHPVEIGVHANGALMYITDFGYVGVQPHVELAKCLDFDFQASSFQHHGQDFPMDEAIAVYRMWESNFLAYHEFGVYRVSVTAF